MSLVVYNKSVEKVFTCIEYHRRGNPFVKARMVYVKCEVIVTIFNDDSLQTVADGLTLLVAPVWRPAPQLRDRKPVQKTC